MTDKKFKLIERTIELSVNKNWNEAKKEWKVYHIYMSSEYLTCDCGHFPIVEIVKIQNLYNNNIMTIGNCCVKKFIDEDYDNFFHALYRDIINESIILQSFKDRIINEWEKNFLLDVWRKRKFSSKQHNLYETLKNKLLLFYKQKMSYNEIMDSFLKKNQIKEQLNENEKDR